MAIVASISQQIWDMKYRLRAPNGEALDKTIEDTWRRIAKALAEPEREEARAEWEEKFAAALDDFQFLPAGRVVAGAGSARDVTLFNCFVMGAIPDSLSGIFAHLREAALTMQQGGGIGYDFSTLRPRGAYVKGVGAESSGPLSFMDVWDAMCRTIMSAGYRRGAMMATLACGHPDIEAFIEAKREPGRLRMFNLSVLVTDAFMKAVEADAPWQLAFDGTVHKVLPARELWDKIMRATYAYAEPGVIFIDRINQQNNLAYCETIHATNPCLTADTWVHTSEGPRQIGELVRRPFAAIADGRAWNSDARGFFPTGTKPTVSLSTVEGHCVRLTRDHRLRHVTKRTRWTTEWEWQEAGRLEAGDEILLHDHRIAPAWGETADADRERAEGYLLGLLLGDGVLKSDKAVLSVWPGRACVNGGLERPGVAGVMAEGVHRRAGAASSRRLRRMDRRSGPGRKAPRLGALKRLALAHGMRPRAKRSTPQIERRLERLFGGISYAVCLMRTAAYKVRRTKASASRLAQSDRETLAAVQRMLLRLGIASALGKPAAGCFPTAAEAAAPTNPGTARTGDRRKQSQPLRRNRRLL